MKAGTEGDVAEAMARFFHEIGLLKRTKRSGWWVAGVQNPESVAEHAFRTCILGYLLALMEGADPYKTTLMCLFHDTHESRIGDLHRINQLYLNPAEAQIRALSDQLEELPRKVSSQVMELFEEFVSGTTKEAVVARDADVLECLIQAREYQRQGCTSVDQWIRNSYASLATHWAKMVASACLNTDPKQWWHRVRGLTDSSREEGDTS